MVLYQGPFDPVYPCREMETRGCPEVYQGVCGDNPCARYESSDESVWQLELMRDEITNDGRQRLAR